VEVTKVVEACAVGDGRNISTSSAKKGGSATPEASLTKLDKAVVETIENEVCLNLQMTFYIA
jgi:hypothetical protein